MTSPLERFRANDRTEFTTKFWGDFLRTVIAEIDVLKAVRADFQAAITLLNDTGLTRINEVLLPAYLEVEQLANLGLLFQATSASNIGVATGESEFVIAPSERQRFAPSGYLWATASDESGAVMSGQFVSYDRTTGVLRIDVDHVLGEGAHEGWTIAIALPPDLGHAMRTDNPHEVTAEQVGAYTQAEVNAIITALKGGATEALDTLEEIGTAIVARGLKAGETWTGTHDFGSVALTMPRETVVAGHSVPAQSRPDTKRPGGTLSTTSNSSVEALLGDEIARRFALGVAGTVRARYGGYGYATRTGSPAQGIFLLAFRVKQADVWSAWSQVAGSTNNLLCTATGATATGIQAALNGAGKFALPSDATDYQIRLMWQASTETTLYIYPSTFIETMEFA